MDLSRLIADTRQSLRISYDMIDKCRASLSHSRDVITQSREAIATMRRTPKTESTCLDDAHRPINRP